MHLALQRGERAHRWVAVFDDKRLLVAREPVNAIRRVIG